MGRIFEVRKHTMFARWNRMAKQFARIAKDITMAAKAGGPDPASNPALRRYIQNARGVNMPKDKVEAAIKRASGRDAALYQEVIYEAYAPHGVALLVETATDNPTRTVAGVRNVISKNGGKLATNGSVSFLFEEMGETTGDKGEPQLVIRCAFANFGKLQEALEARGITPLAALHEYLCFQPVELLRSRRPRLLRSSTSSSRTRTCSKYSTRSPEPPRAR